ncbi:MAG: IS66 family transposase, partial [Sulfobacillus benefaciens]
LERQIHRNSHNSSQPPSADGFKKPPPRSQRPPSGRRPGGQPGHPGDTLKPVAHPDVIQRHPVGQCARCGRGLHPVPLDRLIRRQVFDIPPLVLQVTEHQVEVKTCPDCAHVTMGTVPAHVGAPVQYGPQLLGLSTYLQMFQMIPVDRVRAMFTELWGQAPSAGTLLDAVRRAADAVRPALDVIRTHLRQAPVVNADETGLRVEGHLWWMHTLTAPGWTLFGLHRHRGQIAMQAMGVLAERQRIVVHDYGKPYYRFEGRHALCNAHLLRDLTRVIETTQDAWARRLQTLLVDMHRVAAAARDAG